MSEAELQTPDKLPKLLPRSLVRLVIAIHYVIQALHLPTSRQLEYVMCYLLHIKANRRLPVKRLLFNDVYFRVKTDGSLARPLAVKVSDKELVKQHVGEVLGPQHAVPTLAILTSAAQVRAYDFPARCCIKPTHSCGQYIVRQNGEALNIKQIAGWLKFNFYGATFEANYRPLARKVIVERLAFDMIDPPDFKIHCVNGKARMIEVVIRRTVDRTCLTYDTNWNRLPFTVACKTMEEDVERPANLDAMIAASEKLAAGFFLVRIDLYSDGKTFMVGEITNCPSGGLEPFWPAEGELHASHVMFSGVPPERWKEFFGT
ncbi:ATP-grasp fold amidoligase family protein [Aestuariivirga litoralis]|uniref:ATP-grasp fold amidoligase family protein n=1 Tax=Aestuariivirga litoralis TaxID=2650924 RepID=UPI0018C7FD28|nr:ATP-grasp fold amidoligase family protein [Aestuariivirga litoralis]MBG1231236.1 hypothetical protein [Aestuariivirga litoralis]